jgi:hypothetical protein
MKNLCQVKQEKYMNKKKLNINMVHHLCLDLDQARIDQVHMKQPDHLGNKDLATMNHASEKSKREAWHRGTGCDGEGHVDV